MPRVHRWWAFLQAYDFDIKYREGKHMSHADFFSRNPLPINNNHKRVKEKRINLAEISENWLQAEQRKDDKLNKIILQLKNNDMDPDIAKTYLLKLGVLHRKIQRNNRTQYLPIVPVHFRWSV